MKRNYLLLVLLLVANVTLAQKLPFQGRLLDGGRPYNGSAEITFSIDNPSWTETRPAVNVVDGYYSVTLGTLTPLPDTLFAGSREVQMNITVEGTPLSPVTLHSPLAPFEIAGSKAVEVDTLDALSIRVNDAEGNVRSLLRSSANGFGGLTLSDSLDRGLNFWSTNRNGGTIQIGQQNPAGNFTGAVVANTFSNQNSGIRLFAGNPTDDGAVVMWDMYASNLDGPAGNPTPYRKGGFNISNMYGVFTHDAFSFDDEGIQKSAMNLYTSENGANQNSTVELFSGDSIAGARVEARGKDLSIAKIDVIQDTGGSDPTGTNGVLSLWGDSSPNIVAQANTFEDHDLPVINMYGSIEDGGGWWFNSGQIGALRAGTGDEFGYLGFNNNTTGTSTNTATLTANLNDSGGGGLELNDASGSNRIFLDGASGAISANRTDGGSAANLFVASDNGGIAIQNASDVNKLFYEAGAGSLELRDDVGGTQIQLDGNLANLNILNPEGNFGITNRVGLAGDLNASGAGGIELLGPTGLGVSFNGLGGGQFYNDAGIVTIGFDADQPAINIGTGVDDDDVRVFAGGISGGSASFENGFNLTHNSIDGPRMNFISGSVTTLVINGNNGDIASQGAIDAVILSSSDGTVQTSDLRLKKNIKNLKSPLEKTVQMRGVSYKWKDTSMSQRNQIGVIAQEVEEIYPEFVHTDAKGMKAVNYAQMTAVLIEAIKELNTKVEALESENLELKASLEEVQTMRKELDQLMKVLGSSKAASK